MFDAIRFIIEGFSETNTEFEIPSAQAHSKFGNVFPGGLGERGEINIFGDELRRGR
jgi:hypothetical protein